MTHAHAWSRWIRGRRTQLWFRVCLGCATSERSDSTDRPEDQDRARGVPDVWADSVQYTEDVIDVRGRMERFNSFRAKAVMRKNVVDFRAKQIKEA